MLVHRSHPHGEYLSIAGTLPYKKKVIIAGNHDAWFDNETYDRMRKCKEGVSFALARHCYGNKWAEFLRYVCKVLWVYFVLCVYDYKCIHE